MKTYESATPLVATIDGKRMIGRVVLWVETDPYSRLIVKFGFVVRWACVIPVSKSTFGQLSETVNTHRPPTKVYEIDHSPHGIHLVGRSGYTLVGILPRHYRKHLPRSEKKPVRWLPRLGRGRRKPTLRRRIRK